MSYEMGYFVEFGSLVLLAGTYNSNNLVQASHRMDLTCG